MSKVNVTTNHSLDASALFRVSVAIVVIRQSQSQQRTWRNTASGLQPGGWPGVKGESGARHFLRLGDVPLAFLHDKKSCFVLVEKSVGINCGMMERRGKQCLYLCRLLFIVVLLAREVTPTSRCGS